MEDLLSTGHTRLVDNFEDIIWGAGGFGCMRVVFESGFIFFLYAFGIKP